MLEALQLRCRRGRRELFGGLSFAAGPGELVRVAGDNGAGKTSLLRILCGLLTPDEGEVRWKGAGIRGLREEYSRDIAYLGHAPAVKDELTALENLEYACLFSGSPVDKAKAKAALDSFGVPPDSLLKKLSQGQRRRAALARLALAGKVPLWLLDEPLAALDAGAAAQVEALARAHAAEGGTVVFTTHQETKLAATRVVELHG